MRVPAYLYCQALRLQHAPRQLLFELQRRVCMSYLLKGVVHLVTAFHLLIHLCIWQNIVPYMLAEALEAWGHLLHLAASAMLGGLELPAAPQVCQPAISEHLAVPTQSFNYQLRLAPL